MKPRSFESYVERTPGCWWWRGGHNSSGYGYFSQKPRCRGAHRVAYELAYGPIPDGLTIDHLCRNKNCVNPAHLEAVSMRVNVLRGSPWAGRDACSNGHPYSDGSWRYVKDSKGYDYRACLICQRAANRRETERRRLARAA